MADTVLCNGRRYNDQRNWEAWGYLILKDSVEHYGYGGCGLNGMMLIGLGLEEIFR